MPQSLAQKYLHIIFSTKNRQPFFIDLVVRTELLAYLAEVCKNLDSPTIQIGRHFDHIHILCTLGRERKIASFAKELKRISSMWLKVRFSKLHSFYWQNGYGAFSISSAHLEMLIGYITNQEAHHGVEIFQDEFRRILTKYGLSWNERYIWD